MKSPISKATTSYQNSDSSMPPINGWGFLNLCILLQSLHYLILISEVEETEIFKICLEYWNTLAADLYRESPFSSTSPLLIGKSHTEMPLRRQLYNPVLSKVRRVMISRMAKPEEVLVVENEQGEVVREFMKDTDSINMYKNMRETLGMSF